MPPSRTQKRRLIEAASDAVVAEGTRTAGLGDGEGDAVSLGLVNVRDTGTGKGHGLFATAPLSDGAFLGDYTGDVLTHDEYLARYPAEDARYVLAANTDYNIDAVDQERASLLRFLNHSSEPNCYYDVRRVRGQRQKRVSFFTSRAVEAGDELCFDYGQQYWADRRERPLAGYLLALRCCARSAQRAAHGTRCGLLRLPAAPLCVQSPAAQKGARAPD
eukprot:scaffold2403_cov141-Isochrysis_galbana.AAC.3